MACERLLRSGDMTTKIYFIDSCEIMPGGGVGHHFHNRSDEMFIDFDGEAQFAIGGQTSLLKSPAGSPCRMGHSHAIYNPTRQPVQFLIINIPAVKGRYGAYNLEDARVGVPLDPIPVFMNVHLGREMSRYSAGHRWPNHLNDVVDDPHNLTVAYRELSRRAGHGALSPLPSSGGLSHELVLCGSPHSAPGNV